MSRGPNLANLATLIFRGLCLLLVVAPGCARPAKLRSCVRHVAPPREGEGSIAKEKQGEAPCESANPTQASNLRAWLSGHGSTQSAPPQSHTRLPQRGTSAAPVRASVERQLNRHRRWSPRTRYRLEGPRSDIRFTSACTVC